MKLRPRYPVQFLVALLAAFVMWYALSAQRRESVSVRGAQAALTLVNLPRDLVLTSNVPETVALRLRGPRSLLADPGTRLEVLLDLVDAQPGLRAYPIRADQVELPDQSAATPAEWVEAARAVEGVYSVDAEREVAEAADLAAQAAGYSCRLEMDWAMDGESEARWGADY